MVTVGIASIPSRSKLLKNTIDSLYNQADKFYVALNGYGTIPQWCDAYDKVTFILTDNTMGDANKFMFIDKCEGYYFSCDDDLIYPETYVKDMIWAVDWFNAVITLAGKKYGINPIENWRTDFTLRIHCLKACKYNWTVDVGGTGVMAFHTDFFKPNYKAMLRRNMADIWIAKQAREQKVNIIALGHEGNYLTYQKPNGKTIWQRNDDEQYITDLLNEFL